MTTKSKDSSRESTIAQPVTASALIEEFAALRRKLDDLDKRVIASGLTLPEVRSLFASQMSRIENGLE